MNLAALALPIRPVRPAGVGALVPLNAQPAKAVRDAGFLGRVAPLGVRILDPEHEPTALLAREQEVEEGGARAPNVDIAGRTWRHANSNRIGHELLPGAASRAHGRRPERQLVLCGDLRDGRAGGVQRTAPRASNPPDRLRRRISVIARRAAAGIGPGGQRQDHRLRGRAVQIPDARPSRRPRPPSVSGGACPARRPAGRCS